MLNLTHIVSALLAGLAAPTAPATADAPKATTPVAETAVTPQFFFAAAIGGKIVVDVPRAKGEPDPVETLGVDDLAQPENEEVPTRVRELEFASVVLATGRVEPSKPIGFGSDGGASNTWWTAHYAGAATAESVGLAITGESTDATLRVPAPVRIKGAEGERWANLTSATLDTALSRLDRTRLGKKVLSQSRLSVIPGKFPGGATMLVALNVPLRSKDPSAEPRVLAGLFTLDEAGALVSTIRSPKTGGDTFEVRAVGDVDGDGFDDLLYGASYIEGRYEHLVRWSDGKPVDTVLTGDGA